MAGTATMTIPSTTGSRTSVGSKIPTYLALAVGAIALAICILLTKETKKMKKDMGDAKRQLGVIQNAPAPPKVEDQSEKVDMLEKKLQGAMGAMQRMQMGVQAIGQKVAEMDTAMNAAAKNSPPPPAPPVEAENTETTENTEEEVEEVEVEEETEETEEVEVVVEEVVEENEPTTESAPPVLKKRRSRKKADEK